METFALLIFGGAILFWLLFRSSLGKSATHEQAQADWRQRVVSDLNLGEHVQSDGITLGLDEARERLAVVYPSGNGHWIPLEHIRSVELLPRFGTNSESISVTRTDRGSQLAGAAVGGIAAGPVGAAIGGLSGSKTTETTGDSSTYVESLEVKLRLRSDRMPAISLSFSEGPRFDAATKSFSGGIAGVEAFAEHLVWEVEKRAQIPAGANQEQIAEINVSSRPANSEGWWTSTFGG